MPTDTNTAAWTFEPGQIVVNFGQRATIEAVDAKRGLLLRALPGQGFQPGADRWYADPASCRPSFMA